MVCLGIGFAARVILLSIILKLGLEPLGLCYNFISKSKYLKEEFHQNESPDFFITELVRFHFYHAFVLDFQHPLDDFRVPAIQVEQCKIQEINLAYKFVQPKDILCQYISSYLQRAR